MDACFWLSHGKWQLRDRVETLCFAAGHQRPFLTSCCSIAASVCCLVVMYKDHDIFFHTSDIYFRPVLWNIIVLFYFFTSRLKDDVPFGRVVHPQKLDPIVIPPSGLHLGGGKYTIWININKSHRGVNYNQMFHW